MLRILALVTAGMTTAVSLTAPRRWWITLHQHWEKCKNSSLLRCFSRIACAVFGPSQARQRAGEFNRRQFLECAIMDAVIGDARALIVIGAVHIEHARLAILHAEHIAGAAKRRVHIAVPEDVGEAAERARDRDFQRLQIEPVGIVPAAVERAPLSRRAHVTLR